MFLGTNPIKRNWLGIVTIVVAGIAQSGYAAGAGTGSAYYCDIKTHGEGHWTPESMVFRFRQNDSKVTVLDGMIRQELGRPLTVAVKNRQRGIKRFRWVLSARLIGGASISVTQRVDFDPARLTGKIFTNHQGFSGEPLGGTLSCKPYKGDLV